MFTHLSKTMSVTTCGNEKIWEDERMCAHTWRWLQTILMMMDIFIAFIALIFVADFNGNTHRTGRGLGWVKDKTVQ